MAKKKSEQTRVGKQDGLYYCCVEFRQINFNCFFSATLDKTTNPTSYLYTAKSKDGGEEGEPWVIVNVATYYAYTKIPPTNFAGLPIIKLKNGDTVRVVGNIAHIYSSEPVFAVYLAAPVN
jgi:hypothetical protein